jgi:hypothetical protein
MEIGLHQKFKFKWHWKITISTSVLSHSPISTGFTCDVWPSKIKITCIWAQFHFCIYIYVYMINIHTYIYIYKCIIVYQYVYIYIYALTYIDICIVYIYRERDFSVLWVPKETLPHIIESASFFYRLLESVKGLPSLTQMGEVSLAQRDQDISLKTNMYHAKDRSLYHDSVLGYLNVAFFLSDW